MLNKLLQKTRNSKLESAQAPIGKPLSQSGFVNVVKQSIDLQKDSYTFSASSATQIPSSSQSSSLSQKQFQNAQIAQNIPSSVIRQTSPVSSSLCSSNVSVQLNNSQQPSSRTSASVNMSNSQFVNSYNQSNNKIANLYNKQRASMQVTTNTKQQFEVAQENSQINTPQTIKYKTFDTQNLSIQRVAVNLSNMDEFKDSESKRDTAKSYQQSPGDSTKREQQLEGTIKTMQLKIEQLVKELERQTNLSNQALEDNSLFRKKYQELKENSSQKQQPPQSQQNQNSLFGRSDSLASSQVVQSDLASSIQILELQEENKKLKQKYQSAQLQASQWRDKFENLEKLQDQHEENLKEKLKDQYSKEIQALNNELNKYKSQQFGLNKSKKAQSIIRSSNNNNANNMLKENTNNNNMAQTYTDDWHQNYMLLKEDKEKAEKMLKKRIESLEEQNAFLQNEVSQLHQKHDQLQEINVEPNFVVKQQYNYNQDPQMQNRKSNNLQELNYYFSQNLN